MTAPRVPLGVLDDLEADYTGPCVFCQHPAGEHDVEAECWRDGCECGTGEAGDPALSSALGAEGAGT